MFDHQCRFYPRASLFMAGCPALVWLLFRLGYEMGIARLDRLAAGLVLAVTIYSTRRRASGQPNLPSTLITLRFNDSKPQHWVNQNLYVILWLGGLWLVFFLPPTWLAQNLACHRRAA